MNAVERFAIEKERQQLREKLQQSEENARLVLENSLDAIINMDATGLITEWSGAATRMFGYQREEAIGRVLAELIIPPQLSILGNQVTGAEALLRWEHPELGAISPAEFIPVAEDSGLILPIGEWVLRQAVQQAKIWLENGHPPLVMAVNLSAVQFRHPDLPNLVTRILAEASLPPEYLELELTEGVAMHDPQGAIAVMNNLHDRGIRMSIDDFGTGYSSLSYLKKFKVYKLKIDQSFVRDIITDPEDKAIVSAIIHMARSLGLQTIAEGVETSGQLAFLRAQECDEAQGHHFSKPLPAEQFEQFLKNRSNELAMDSVKAGRLFPPEGI
jgi:EAL domain-containing protein (putative c-di-GMP-specific phosphodiesterase class I)